MKRRQKIKRDQNQIELKKKKKTNKIVNLNPT